MENNQQRNSTTGTPGKEKSNLVSPGTSNEQVSKNSKDEESFRKETSAQEQRESTESEAENQTLGTP